MKEKKLQKRMKEMNKMETNENKAKGLKAMFTEAEQGLARFRNIIGIGVMISLIVLIFISLHIYEGEKEIANSCGFETEKLKCVCTQDAWEYFELMKRNPYVEQNLDITNLTSLDPRFS